MELRGDRDTWEEQATLTRKFKERRVGPDG